MKEILASFLALTILVMPVLVLADHVKGPPNLPSRDKFQNLSDSNWPCGVLERYGYQEDLGTSWSMVYMQNKENPLVVVRQVGDKRELWLDRDRDGHFDEYYNDFEAFYSKYPTPCDAATR